MRITAVIITKDEQKTIKRCMESLAFCDEIVVIDDNSSDKTVEISKKLGAKVFNRSLKGNYSKQRNFGLGKAKYEWVLFVDADEVVSKELQKELKQLDLNATEHDGFFIRRSDVIWGIELKRGESGSIKILRFGRRGAGKFKRKVHEYWDMGEKTSDLKGKLIHYPHQNLRQFIASVSIYSKLHAEENATEGKSSNLLKIIFYPTGKFIYNYFYKLAILDGIAGFVVSVIMSFHSFISWSSLWLIERKDN